MEIFKVETKTQFKSLWIFTRGAEKDRVTSALHAAAAAAAAAADDDDDDDDDDICQHLDSCLPSIYKSASEVDCVLILSFDMFALSLWVTTSRSILSP